MTPERLKEIREILDSDAYIQRPSVLLALKAADELYDEVSSRMPVSVEERFPKEGERVQWCDNSGYWEHGTYDPKVPGYWPDYDGFGPQPFDNGTQQITHWMPLPATGGST
jgi:hypothetical protein